MVKLKESFGSPAPAYVTRGPLHIVGDEDFARQAAMNNWPGNGTECNPYIIEGYEIDGNGSNAIWIENTSVHFIIRNCNLYNATGTDKAGIAFNNVRNATIENNNLSGNCRGIYLYSSCNINITNNNASGNSWHGISLECSSNNNITNNNASGNSGVGIALGCSSNNNITNNNASGNSVDGIYLSSSSSNNITNNNASGNSYDGIALDHSGSNNITNNNASGNSEDGIHLYSSSNNTITNNNVSGNSEDGIHLYSSSNNSITNNNASGNSGDGICLFYSGSNSITNNNASGNSWDGISLGDSGSNIITNNNASGNSCDGIHMSHSGNNNISNNNASGNSWDGISLCLSSNNTITNNILWENGIGIWGENLEHWNTHNIDASNLVNGKPVYYYKNQNGGNVPSDAGQVILANCSNMVISGLTISNASIAIQLGFSNYNIVTNNNASGNSYYGISLYYSSNNIITYNWICNNANYGVYITDGSTSNHIHHNYFICNGATALRYLSQSVSNDTPNGAKGVSGKSQAYDSVGGNYWYDNIAKAGNYWSNWDGQGWGTPDAYPIDGRTASDWYPCRVPSPPQNLKATAMNKKIMLTWEMPLVSGGFPITNYIVYRNGSLLVELGNVTNYTDTGLVNGVAYTYKVSAVNSIGEGQCTKEITAIPATVPSAPKNLRAEGCNRKVILSWEMPDDDGGFRITGYRIYRNGSLLVELGNVTNYTDTGLVNGVAYTYKVSAVNSIGEGQCTEEITAIPSPELPSAPRNLRAVSGNRKVILSWEMPDDDGGSPITGYRIYRNGSLLVELGNVTNYTDTGLVNGVAYTYKVS
ncbi:MAG: NosD domain-containing protein, partial [Thermoplasmata archaeon]